MLGLSHTSPLHLFQARGWHMLLYISAVADVVPVPSGPCTAVGAVPAADRHARGSWTLDNIIIMCAYREFANVLAHPKHTMQQHTCIWTLLPLQTISCACSSNTASMLPNYRVRIAESCFVDGEGVAAEWAAYVCVRMPVST